MSDPEQSPKPSKEAVEAVLLRVRALQTQLAQEQQALTRQPGQELLSAAYKRVLDRLGNSLRSYDNLKGSPLENYTDVTTDYLRILGEATHESTQELYKYAPMETPEGLKYTQLLLDLNARILQEINEVI